MTERIHAAIETLRPGLLRAGGDVDLVAVSEGGEVRVRPRGSCAGCPISRMTLLGILQDLLRREVDPTLHVVLAE